MWLVGSVRHWTALPLRTVAAVILGWRGFHLSTPSFESQNGVTVHRDFGLRSPGHSLGSHRSTTYVSALVCIFVQLKRKDRNGNTMHQQAFGLQDAMYQNRYMRAESGAPANQDEITMIRS